MSLYLVPLIIIISLLLLSIYLVFLKPVIIKNYTNNEAITIAQFGDFFLYAPLYIALDNNYFSDEGLDVDIVSTGGDEKTFLALLSGEAQFGVADPTFIAVSGEQGRPGRLVASILNGVPFSGISNDPNIKVSDISDLKNKTIATIPAPSTAYTLQRELFETANLQPQIFEVAPGSLIASLQDDQVDIALELEPNVSSFVKNGGNVVYSMSDYWSDFALTGLTTLPDYIDENEGKVQKVVTAIDKSMQFIQNNPSETAKLLKARFPEVEDDVAKEAIDNMIEKNIFPKNTLVSKAGWEAAIDLRKKVGDIQNSAPYDTYVITRFSEK